MPLTKSYIILRIQYAHQYCQAIYRINVTFLLNVRGGVGLTCHQLAPTDSKIVHPIQDSEQDFPVTNLL